MTLKYEDIVYVMLFIGFFFLLLILLKTRFSRIAGLINMEDVEVIKLRNQVNELQKEVAALKLTINVLIDKLSAANVKINPDQLPVEIKPKVKVVSRPVLLVYGDSAFGELDRNAMRRAGVSFFRLVSSSLEDLKDELQRRRSDGRMYDVVHLSAHGKDNTILLTGENVNGISLSDVLNGVRCVFLATCNNQQVADKLVGIVQYVVVIYEEINTEDAANFTYEFYKRYKVDMNIEDAFNGAMSVMPSISEFVDLRIGGK